MSTQDDDGSQQVPGSTEVPLWWDPAQNDLMRRRKAEQVRMLVEAFDRAGTPIGVYPSADRPEDMEFMYRKGVVLTRDADAAAVHDALGVDPGRDKGARGVAYPTSGLEVIQLPETPDDTRDWFAELDNKLGVGVAVPDHVVHISPAGACPATEPLPTVGSPVPSINTDPDTDGRQVRVAVVDTGLLPTVVADHVWLTGVTGDLEPPSVGHYTGHGTFVAGIIRTMAPRAEVHVEGILIVGGAVFETDLAPALARALDLMPDIISMSAGTTTRSGLPLLAMQVFNEQRLSQTKGTVLVVSAGNDGDRGPFYPATFPWTVAVGALDVDGTRAGYSNHGSWVDVFARGSDVVNAYPRGDYHYQESPLAGQTANFITGMASWSGTSFSAPLVSGLIAARMTWSGESARQAAQSLLAGARANASAGIGAVLEPGMGARPTP